MLQDENYAKEVLDVALAEEKETGKEAQTWAEPVAGTRTNQQAGLFQCL